MMQYQLEDVKEILTIEDIYKIVEELGGNPVLTSFGFIADTICHNAIGEGSNKLYFYNNSKLFQCYTECGSIDIFEVVLRQKQISENPNYNLTEAISYIVDITNNSFNLNKINDISSSKEDLNILKHYNLINKKIEKRDIEYKLFDEKILNNLSFIPPGPWIKEGITVETMKKYNIKYYGTDHKIIIPHYNLNNELIGIRGRSFVEEDAERYGKYMPIKINNIMYNHPLSINLYGLNFNIDNIQKLKKIIIFEGEKSVLLYDSIYGSENNIAVAVCGSSISQTQQDLILETCKVNEIILAFDKEFQKINDDNFKKNKKYLLNIASKFKNYITTTILFDKFNKLNYKDSPIDKGKEVFEYLLNHRIYI